MEKAQRKKGTGHGGRELEKEHGNWKKNMGEGIGEREINS